MKLVVVETLDTGQNFWKYKTKERTFEFTSLQDAVNATELLTWLTEHNSDNILYESEIKA